MHINLYLIWKKLDNLDIIFYNLIALFIQGKADNSVIKFLENVHLYDEFSDFIKKEYNKDLNDLIDKENELRNVNDNKLNDSDKIEKITKDLNRYKIKK